MREWWLLLALAVVPTIFGHSLLNAAMKHFRGNVVSVCNVGQFVFAGVSAGLSSARSRSPRFGRRRYSWFWQP